MSFTRTCLSIVITLGVLSLVAAAKAAPDDPAAAGTAAQPSANTESTAAETVTAPAKDDGRAPKRHRQRDGAATAATASASPAQPTAAAAATTTAAQDPAAPKKICKNMDVMGSKIPRRVCATQDEWATYEGRGREDAQDGLRRLRDQGAQAPASPTVNTSPSVFSPPTR
jgi:hypothetical protein